MVEETPGKTEERKGVSRRRVVFGILTASIAGAFASVLALLKLLIPEKKGGGYQTTIAAGDKLVYAQGEKKGTTLRASSFKVGDAVLAYPGAKTENQANLVQLIRLEEAEFKPPTRLDLTDQGFVAYSAICTHLGCIVSWEKNPKSPAASFTECFCHNSIFDPARGAKVLGGPAPIPLAQIGVKVDGDGSLIFTSGFSGPLGPQV